MNAALTIVWLGPGTLETDKAVDFLENNVIEGRGTFDWPCGLQKFDILEGEDITDLETGLLDLASRPWHWRVWIRQEIWASESVVVLCGEKELDWSRLTEIAKLDLAWKDDRGPGMLRSLRLASVKELYGRQAAKHRQSLGALLIEAALCESSDPRDRIFALLGMSSDQLIKPDYNLDLVGVLCKLAPVICSSYLGYSFLEYRLWHCPSARTEGLPSWCSDWRHLFSSPYKIPLPFQDTTWYGFGRFRVTADDKMYPRSTHVRKWRLYGFILGCIGKELPRFTGDVYLWHEPVGTTRPASIENLEETMSRINELCQSVVMIAPPTISDHVWLHVPKDQPLNGVFLQRAKATFHPMGPSHSYGSSINDDIQSPFQRPQPVNPGVKHMGLTCNQDLFVVDEMEDRAASISEADAGIGIINSADMIAKRADKLLAKDRGRLEEASRSRSSGELKEIMAPPPSPYPQGTIIYGFAPGFNTDCDRSAVRSRGQGLIKADVVKLLTGPFPQELAVSADDVQENDLVTMCLEQASLVVLRPVVGQKQFHFVGMASLNSQWMCEMAKQGQTIHGDASFVNMAWEAHQQWWQNMICVLEERRDAGMLDMFELV